MIEHGLPLLYFQRLSLIVPPVLPRQGRGQAVDGFGAMNKARPGQCLDPLCQRQPGSIVRTAHRQQPLVVQLQAMKKAAAPRGGSCRPQGRFSMTLKD